MADIWIFHGVYGFEVFIVCLLLFFIALFAMIAIVGVAEAIERVLREWAIHRRKIKGEQNGT